MQTCGSPGPVAGGAWAAASAAPAAAATGSYGGQGNYNVFGVPAGQTLFNFVEHRTIRVITAPPTHRGWHALVYARATVSQSSVHGPTPAQGLTRAAAYLPPSCTNSTCVPVVFRGLILQTIDPVTDFMLCCKLEQVPGYIRNQG